MCEDPSSIHGNRTLSLWDLNNWKRFLFYFMACHLELEEALGHFQVRPSHFIDEDLETREAEQLAQGHTIG